MICPYRTKCKGRLVENKKALHSGKAESEEEMEKEKSPWALFFEDIENRVAEECERLKKEANPKKEMKDYIRQTAWMEPELASYLQKKMSKILNLDD